MQLGLIGLGKMGGNMRERIRRAGHDVIGYDRSEVSDVASLSELVEKLEGPRVVWVMVPAGAATVDGRRAEGPARRGRASSSTAAAPAGRTTRSTPRSSPPRASASSTPASPAVCGACRAATPDGRRAPTRTSQKVKPVFDASSPRATTATSTRSKVGAGHFSKMVHNGIEYAMMRGLRRAGSCWRPPTPSRTCARVFRSWQEGTVIRSWLLDLAVNALDDDEHLEQLRGFAQDSGARAAGRWRPPSTTPSRSPRSPRRSSPASRPARTTRRR